VLLYTLSVPKFRMPPPIPPEAVFPLNWTLLSVMVLS
jgi:hypothetical protein